MKKILLLLTVAVCHTLFGAGLTIPSDGLQYHLDATDKSTILENDEGYVTNWVSKVGNLSFVNETPGHLPYYDASLFGGKGGVMFGYTKGGTMTNYNWLTATSVTDNRTIFFVYDQKMDLTGNNVLSLGYYWGEDGVNPTSHAIKGSHVGNGFYIADSHWMVGGAWIDGVWTLPFDSISVRFSFGVPHWFRAEATELQTFKCAIGNSYHVMTVDSLARHNTYGAFAEVIVYDRILEPAEVEMVGWYLRDKWFDGVTVWTGKGTTSDWNDAGNWSHGVPTPGVEALISGGEVSLSSSLKANVTVFTDGFDLVLENGAEFAVSEVRSLESATNEIQVAVKGIGVFASDLGADVKLAIVGANSRVRLDRPIAGLDKVSVEKGVLEVRQSPYELPGLVTRLDASRLESVTTNADGLVMRWDSLTGDGLAFTNGVDGIVGVNQGICYAPKYDPVSGGIRFGYSPTDGSQGVPTTLLSDRKVAAYDFFMVYDLTDTDASRVEQSFQYALIGNKFANELHIGCYGRKWWSNPGVILPPFYHDGCECCITEKSLQTMALVSVGERHVVSVANGDLDAWYSGGQPLWVGKSCAGFTMTERYLIGHLYEVLVYNRRLTTNEVEAVNQYLLDKWRVNPVAALTNICDTVLTNATVELSDGRLDLCGASLSVKALGGKGVVTNVNDLAVAAGTTVTGDLSVAARSFQTPSLALAAADGIWPTLMLDCDFDATATALSLTHQEPIRVWELVATGEGTLTGPFASVDPAEAGGLIRYRSNSAAIRNQGLMIIFR